MPANPININFLFLMTQQNQLWSLDKTGCRFLYKIFHNMTILYWVTQASQFTHMVMFSGPSSESEVQNVCHIGSWMNFNLYLSSWGVIHFSKFKCNLEGMYICKKENQHHCIQMLVLIYCGDWCGKPSLSHYWKQVKLEFSCNLNHGHPRHFLAMLSNADSIQMSTFDMILVLT